jgi:NAD(P)-dependent dehydrogenase (short-subunit alcohol dehydrogenase family)
LDIFFANAGIVGAHKLFKDVEAEEFMRTMKTNVLSVFLAAKYAAPAMQLTSPSKPIPSGSIIATASVAGIRSNAGSTDYSASKAAVISLMQTLSYQLSSTNIRCNAICPGLIETGMTALVWENARKRGTEGKIGQINPMGRGGVADEVARVALFLGSEEASYVNGQAWAVDGGLSAGHPYVVGKMA